MCVTFCVRARRARERKRARTRARAREYEGQRERERERESGTKDEWEGQYSKFKFLIFSFFFIPHLLFNGLNTIRNFASGGIVLVEFARHRIRCGRIHVSEALHGKTHTCMRPYASNRCYSPPFYTCRKKLANIQNNYTSMS